MTEYLLCRNAQSSKSAWPELPAEGKNLSVLWRKFAAVIKDQFAVEEEILFKSEDITLLKIRTFNDELCEIYTVDKIPWLFIVDETKYYPTVYFMWKYPDCLFHFTVHQSVFEKVQGGADIMLPGIIIEGEVTVAKLGKLEKGQPCVVRLPYNKAAVAIGKTNISSLDMLECGLRGKGIQVLHVVGDLLWKLGPCVKIPEIPLETARQLSPELGMEGLTLNDNGVEPSAMESSPQNEEQTSNSKPEEPESVTDIFIDFFLSTLKKNLKSSIDFPILASTFQGKYLSPSINEANLGDKINVQKTEFKKFSVFLKHMEKLGVLKIEKQKDVQKIASVDFRHEMFQRIGKSAAINQMPE
uniref:Eukaryotic translation initiation factor 2D n=1 Tax=Romanomermis culicivorax TaxID=13658 RepID=A0A915JJ81_ROMCU